MLDVAVSYHRYKFLGYEFLTWLWFTIEKEPEKLDKIIGESGFIEIGNRMVIENRSGNDVKETITIKGDDAGLEEGILSLKKGAVVTELNIAYKLGDQRWQFTVKGESFHITNIKIPDTGSDVHSQDTESIVLEKAALCEKIFFIMDNLYKNFIKLRISDNWQNDTLPNIRSWINRKQT